jgi:diguanylate cyclase (GGDEF)-like protein
MRLRSEDARLARYRRPVSIVLVELDGMGRLVQRLGADAAERLVPPIRQTLTRQARGADYVARIGPSRFGIILPETDEIQAINYVERVRVACDRWLESGAVALRLALGWASPANGVSLETALRTAEDRLYAERRRIARTTTESGSGF